jgi:NADPH-dependent 2,4-dienoyl-CoA reductase/sulfur reductase-like enzyme
MARAVIVGAGPAGIAAAAVLGRSGIDITIVDEGRRPGGQIYRTPMPRLQLDMRRILGGGFAAYSEFHRVAESLRERVDLRAETLAWNIHGGAVHLAAAGGLAALSYDALILATGATDRVMPAPGWTLPGVFSLGAAQVLLKDQGCLIGQSVVFCGSSPLLYLAALQHLRVGGTVAAVIDTTPFAAKLRSLPELLAAPGVFATGLRYMQALRRAGVPLLHGAAVTAFEGSGRLAAVRYRRDGGAEQRIACDAAAYGHGLRPETQLAELAGCALRYDSGYRLHLPVIDGAGRAGKAVYIAGDGGIIGGAEAAALSGALAGAAALRDLGLQAPALHREERRLRRLRRFQRGLALAFAWPHQRVASLDDSVTLCRCEGVTVGAVRAASRRPLGAAEVNRVKAATRCGMGRCQGRFCGPAAAELTAATLGGDARPGHLRAQPPIKPLPIRAAEGAAP